KEYLTVGESVARWGRPLPWHNRHGYHNRTEGCSWLVTKATWEKYGPLPRFQDGVTGDCWFGDELEFNGYRDYLVRDCITYHFFRGEQEGYKDNG
ncbi:MAG: hypothetical protein ACXABY_26960, partial [Candidatus Thorarchaeota archaeon]